jgi:hypothetical protein
MRKLSGLLLIASLGIMTATGRAADNDKLLPNDTKAVLTINVKQMLDSPLFKKLDDKAKIKALLKKRPEVTQLVDSFGLDVTKDIDQVVVALTGAGKGEESVMMIRGTFDRAKLEAVAKDEKFGVKIIKEGNYTLYEKADKKGEPVYGAIVDNSILAVSQNKSFVVDVLDKNAGKKTTALKKDFADLLAKADAKLSVSIVALPQGLGGAQAAEVGLDKLKTLIGGVKIADDIKVTLSLVAKDENNAKDAAKLLDDGLAQAKALAGFVAGQKKELAPLLDVLDSFKIEAKGSDVSLKGEVSKDNIDKLLEAIPQLPKKQ